MLTLNINGLGVLEYRVSLVGTPNDPKVFTCADTEGNYYLCLLLCGYTGVIHSYLVIPLTNKSFLDLTLQKKSFTEVVLSTNFGYFISKPYIGDEYTNKEVSITTFLCDYFIHYDDYMKDSTTRHLISIKERLLNLGKN